MRPSRFVLIIALYILAAWPFQEAAARNCAETLRIDQTTSLSFGDISVSRGASGVIIVSTAGHVATVGQLSAGPGAHPGIIRLCGPASVEFTLMITPTAAGKGARSGMRGELTGDLELKAAVGQIRSAGTGEWIGRLGGHGVAEIHIGGRLRIVAARPNERVLLSFDLTVLPH